MKKLTNIKNLNRQFVLILVYLFVSFNLSGATITSTGIGGLWNSTDTWVGNTLPTTADDVIIADGAIVTIDAIATVKSVTIGQGASGILQWGAVNNALTVSGNVLINPNGALLQYTTSPTAATLNVGGNFTNNGTANMSMATLNFNGSQQSGGSMSQTLGGTGNFVGQGTSGIIRSLFFQTTGSSTINTSQNLIVTLAFTHSAGSLNTNGKLTIDNTAQVYGLPFNTQVASIAVTNSGSGYTTPPVVSANGAIKWTASTAVTTANVLVAGTNVYAVTANGTTGGVMPSFTNTTGADGTATLMWVGNTGTIGNALLATVVQGTQYFYGTNLYTAISGGAINTALPPVHTTLNSPVMSGAANFLYVGPAAQVSVNHNATTQKLHSLTITNTGNGYASSALPAPGLSIINTGAGTGAAATAVLFARVDGLPAATTSKSAVATITGGLNINSTQGAAQFSGVGNVNVSSGGVNYTAAPTVGFAGPTGINLVTAGGSGYTGAPTITVSGGTLVSGAALTSSNFTIVVAGGKVVSVYLNSGSTSCYSVPPALAFTGGGGSGATLAFPAGSWPAATATVGNNRQVIDFVITNPGFGYVTAPNVGVGTTGTFSVAAQTFTSRIATYNLVYGLLTPASTNSIFTEGVEVPVSRRFNAFTMNSALGATFTGNISLMSATPLTLTSGKVNLGTNTISFLNPSYAGVASTAAASIFGVINLNSPGGSVTRTFPFERSLVIATGVGSNSIGSTITSLTVSVNPGPTGTVSPGSNYPTGTKTYRIQTNSGAVYGTTPAVTLNYGPEDAIIATNNTDLLIARASAITGPWTVVSTSVGSGALSPTGLRTTNSSFTGTTDDYLAFTTTTAPCTTTPNSGSIPAVAGFCTASGSVTISLTGYTTTSSGLTFSWIQSNDDINFTPVNAGIGFNTPVYTTPMISSTIYYRVVVTCAGGGIPDTSNSIKAGPVNCQYNVTRNTNITYNSIMTTGNTYTTWTATTPGDDEYTNAVSLAGTTFLYQGLPVSAFYASTNGFISFNTALQHANSANNLISGTTVNQVVAPFWDDLVLRGGLASNHDNCMRYKINGTLGSGTADIIIEWADMERFGFGSPNINFQIVLHESDNSIDFNYGNYQLYDGSVNNATLFSYSVGLNGSNPAGGTLSDRMILQRENTSFFGTINQNLFSLTPECNSQLHFVPAATYTGVDPGPPGIPANNEHAGAFTLPINPAPCIVLCDNIYTSASATATPAIPVCSAGTPGNADDDVFFKFITTSETQYRITVTPSLNYDAVFQLLDGSLNQVLCINAAAVGLTETTIATGLTANGATYYIRVYDAGAAAGASHNGEFAICVNQLLAPPTNDDCAAATTLTVGSTCNATTSQQPATLAATASAGIPACNAASPGTPDDDVWYTFTTNASTGLEYNVQVTGNSTYNAVLQIFSGACGALVNVGCINASGNGGAETFTSTTLTANTTYRVRVYHFGNGANNGDFQICVFISPPPCPGGLAPANGTTVPVAGTTLSWNAVPLATNYEVYFSTDSAAVANESGLALVSTQNTLTYTTLPLTTNTKYFWKVVALAGVFRSVNCSVRSINTSPPACVVITNPLNNTIVCYRNSFNLTWNAVAGATGYDVYLDAGAGPAVNLVSANQSGTSFNIALSSLSDGPYSWRIEPRNFIGPNSACSNNSFTIVTPPTVSIFANPSAAIICPGESVALSATGANNYIWTPATGLNVSTGSSVTASPTQTVVYAVTGENVAGCGSTVTQAVTVNPVPSPPTVSNYTMCTGGAIPPGEGLIANCGGGTQLNSITFPLTTPSVNEGTTCPGSQVIGTFNFPPIPSGSTLVSAGLVINGIFLKTNSSTAAESWGTEIRLNFSGTAITSNTTCFQGASTNFVPNPVNWVTGVPTAADATTLKNLLNVAGGTIIVKYNESADDITTESDVIFPATATFNYTITVPVSSPNWYDAAVGGNLLGSGSPFDPITSQAIPNSNTPGTYTFYARCANSFCQSSSSSADLIIGQQLVANATQSGPGTVCAGTPIQLSTSVTGGGTPYSYSWSPATGLNNSTTATPVATPQSSTVYTVTVTDACGNIATSTVSTNVNPAPTIQVSPTTASSCATNPGSYTLTASGGTGTYTWAPATGLNNTNQASVLASPTASTNYTVTGTGANGCTGRAVATIVVSSPLIVNATATPSSLCQNGSSQLTSVAVPTTNSIVISEVTLFRTGTGATLTYPAFVTGADLVEISNTSNSPIDISGYTFGDYPNASSVANHPYTFPSGTIIPGQSVLVLCIGSGTDDVANRYYNTGGSSDSWGSGTPVGMILKNGTTIIDAVGLNTGYTFNAATGVTSAFWTGIAPSAAGFAGTIRTGSADSNQGSDWTQSSAALPQTIGTYNGNYIAPLTPTFTYSWSPSTFLNNPNIANPTAANVTGATNTYTVTASAGVGGCSSTATVTLSITPFNSATINSSPSNPAICAGSSHNLSSTISGGSGPFTYSWSPATGLNNTTGTSVIATPSATTTYTLSVTDNCGITKVSAPVTITVNPIPVVSVTGAPATFTICGSGFVDLTANGGTTYTWAPSTGLNSTTLQTVRATPSVTTTYTVTGTSSGCSGTSSVTVVRSSSVSVTTSANVNPGCSPLTTIIHANASSPTGTAANYVFASGAQTLNPMTVASTLIGSGVDGNPSSPGSIGFIFGYEGVNYTSFSVSPDGWLKLGPVPASTEHINNLASGVNIPRIAPFWDDLSTGTNGNVKSLLTGTAPNRILIIQWFLASSQNLTNPASLTFQAWLYESNGKIEFRYGTMANVSSASVGITGAAASNYNSVTVTSGTASTTSSNNTITTPPASGTMYSFTPLPPSLTYSWTPSSNLNSTTLADPTVSGLTAPSTTYTVTVTNAAGCTTSSTLTLNVNPSPPAPSVTYPGSPSPAPLTFCQGGSITLDGTGSYSSYAWTVNGGTTVLSTTPTFTATTTGDYAVHGTGANGCSSSTTVHVEVQSATPAAITYVGYPNNQSALTFCQGGNVLLTASGAYSAFSWTRNGDPTVLATTQSYSATQAGTYTVMVTSDSNPCTATSSIVVNVTPGPPQPTVSITGGTMLCDDGSTCATITASGTAGYSFVWNDANGSTTNPLVVCGNDDSFLFFGNPYEFKVTIFDPNSNCPSTSPAATIQSVCCNCPNVTLTSKVYLEGYYSGSGLMQWAGSGYMHVTGVSTNPTDVDTLEISIMNPTFPYGLVESRKEILQTNGNISATFSTAVVPGNSYYIMLKHHNHVETWSAAPVVLSSATNYMFATAATQAFASNMANTFDALHWAMFAGDINQDGQVDGTDFLLLDPEIQNGNGGYNIYDLNGDGQVDGTDFLILDPNIQNGIGVARP